MNKWYTADLHFGHKNIIQHCNRPFEGTDDMDAVLLRNLQNSVGPADQLWIVGDFSFGRKSSDRAYLEAVFEQLPGAEKHLVVGNHDKNHILNLPWTTVSEVAEVRDGPQNQAHTLFHYPLITWNHARRGALQLFGHVHDNWLGSRNSINVGVDVWGFKPLLFEAATARAMTLPVNPVWPSVEPGADL